MVPTDEGPRIRQGHYVVLGVAGVVIATVFAVVASLASRSPAQVQFPELPGPVVADSSSSTAGPTSTTTTTTTVAPTTTTPPVTTTTTTRRTTTTTTTTPPKPGPKPPLASFTATCNGRDCTFDGSSSRDPDGTIVYWAWNFGDGQGVNGQRLPRPPAHHYANPGRYTVTLLVMDNDGKIGRATAEVNVSG